MLKKQIREKYKTLRNQRSTDQIEEDSIEVANKTLKLPIWEKTYYHIFLPIQQQKEVNTEFLLNVLFGKNKEVVVSKSDFKEHTLSHFLLTENTKLEINTYGIPEPVSGLPVPENMIDVVFVPLLGFDEKGNRVGYGKGFYDDFLQKCKPETLKIGLSFFEAAALIEDAYWGDIPLDYCVTPNKIYNFKNV